MFSQSADQAASDQSPAPVGMRELPPQPAKPVMPAYTSSAPEPVVEDVRPGPEDTVIAKDDHLEGTFTSRGTVVVMGSVKGRIEAVQVRIEDGATVEADVIVDEAIIAGEFIGNLTCRERLEAQASGRINGHVETFKLMLHEGASVEGEMHMLAESPSDASETIRGSAPVRGGTMEADNTTPEAKVEPAAPIGRAATTKPAPSVTPSSTVKPVTSTSDSSTSGAPEAAAPSTDTASAARQSVAATLRAESLRVAPRTSSTVASYSGTSNVSNGSRDRSGSSSTF
jgi:cytoskeletal protein CcmA (bactofilin family)